MPLYHKLRRDRRPKGAGFLSRPRRGGIFSRITTLFGTAVEAARSSEGIFNPIYFLFLFYVEECPVDPMRMRVDSIMKLDQKSKVKSERRGIGNGAEQLSNYQY